MKTAEEQDTSLIMGGVSAKVQERYEQLHVFEKITGKSAFKDYDVLMEAYEKKVMIDIYIQSISYLEQYKTTQSHKIKSIALPTKTVMKVQFNQKLEAIVNRNAVASKKLLPHEVVRHQETAKEKQVRHNYILEMDEFNELGMKSNPK